ncbi:DUF167 family protein [Hoeflea sp. TYP-13]|uniref:DUF167 family protein n=1 Tax=Hoeflea sp. TYP-13 TaxID=3230023 RepID=UPI0034C5BB61
MTATPQGWFRIARNGLQLFVRLTPGASKDGIDGIEEGADGRAYLKIRVRAVPEKGRANRALIALLAKRGGVAKSSIKVTSGETHRMKTLLFEGDGKALREAAWRLVQ